MKQISKRGQVFINKTLAGIVQQADGLYSFQYDQHYLKRKDASPISLTLPLQSEPFTQKTMLPFFDGLIPEGWLLNIITDNWKINKNDRMSLLLMACKNCIGNISIIADSENNHEKN